MAKRVLVAYATKNGSTTGVAEAIGEALTARGYEADVRPVTDRPPADGYDACVLGSAINGANWIPEAMEFLTVNRDALHKMPVAVFCVHAMNSGPGDKAAAKRLAYLDTVRPVVSPVAEGFFASKGPSPADTNPIVLWIFKRFGGDVIGDGRDWDKIRAWAQDLPV